MEETLGRLGNYDMLELLGRGGMGAVYRARHRVLGVDRAIKILNRGLDPRALERFRRGVARGAGAQEAPAGEGRSSGCKRQQDDAARH